MLSDIGGDLAFVSFCADRQEYAADGTGHGGELLRSHHRLAERLHGDRDCVGVRRGQWRGGRLGHYHGHSRREDGNSDRHRDHRPGSGREFSGRWSSPNTLKFGFGLASLHGSTEASSTRA